jgi:hypothetical protein
LWLRKGASVNLFGIDTAFAAAYSDAMRSVLKILVVLAGLATLALLYDRSTRRVEASPLPVMQSGGTSPVEAFARIGTERREDDLPSLAAAPDGSLWAAWLSYRDRRDEIGVRQYVKGRWSNLQWVPGASGDVWLPQAGVDAQGRVWVVWSEQREGNWDLAARAFDPSTQSWGPLERLTRDPLPDINPRLASDGKGRLALVWQGFRGKNSNIFLKIFENGKWGPDIRVTNRAANDWEPAAVFDASGAVWVAYDSYRKGNYDVYLTSVRDGKPAAEMAVTETPRFETRATVAADSGGRIWVAWEAGGPNWGKDTGYTIRDRQPGVVLGGAREARIRCLENGQWRDPAQPLHRAFAPEVAPGQFVYQPHVFADAAGNIWVAAKRRIQGRDKAAPNRGYWEYYLTRYQNGAWTAAAALPNSRGRSSTRIQAASAGDGALWLTWSTDNRPESFSHRPLRHEVHAGRIAPAAPSPPIGLTAPSAETVNAAAGHADEPGDLKAIRSYRTTLNGKTVRIVRGDFHRHTELSWDGGGAQDGSLQDFYRYMLDAASMDFGASTDHQGGADDYWWWYTQKMTDMYHLPGTYVPIFGYERSVTQPHGHRNIFFATRAGRVTPFHYRQGVDNFALQANPMGDESGIGTGDVVENDTKLLYEAIRRMGGIAISHTSATRMGTDWRDNDPQLEPVVEIFQGARTNYEFAGAPLSADESKDAAHMKTAGYFPVGMVRNAWAKGYRLGIITSSDHGSTHYSYAMAYTDRYDRQGILDAIRRRQTYGATDNIILDVRMGDHFMGSEFKADSPLPLRVRIRGTRAVARVEVIRGDRLIYSLEPNKQDVSFEFADKDGGKRRETAYYYVRVQQSDGQLAWSSPIWVNYTGPAAPSKP